jgi:hypothetical protein
VLICERLLPRPVNLLTVKLALIRSSSRIFGKDFHFSTMYKLTYTLQFLIDRTIKRSFWLWDPYSGTTSPVASDV